MSKIWELATHSVIRTVTEIILWFSATVAMFLLKLHLGGKRVRTGDPVLERAGLEGSGEGLEHNR